MMRSYKKGFVSVVDKNLIYVKNNKAKILFTFPENENNAVSFYNVTPTNELIIGFGTKEKCKKIYCLLESHPTSVPNDPCPQAISGDQKETFAWFHQNLTIFNVERFFDYKIFGSNIVLIYPDILYFYSLKFHNEKLTKCMPTLDIMWKDNISANVSLTRIPLITKIKSYICLENHFIFQQDMCIYIVRDNTMNFSTGYTDNGQKLTGVIYNNNKITHLSISSGHSESGTYDTVKNTLTRGEYIQNTPTHKTYRYTLTKNTKQIKYENHNRKYDFILQFDEEIMDLVELDDKLVVLVNKPTIPNPYFRTNKNILFAYFNDWRSANLRAFDDGILELNGDDWYFISAKQQFKITLEIETDYKFVGFVTLSDGTLIMQQIKESVSSNFPLAKFYKVKSIKKGCIKVIPNIGPLTIVKCGTKFGCFDGHSFINFNDEINSYLATLSDADLKSFNTEDLIKNLENLDYVRDIKEVLFYKTLNANISRLYNTAKTKYNTDAEVVFIEGDQYLETVMLAKKVNRYHSRLTFTLIGSTGEGPTKIVASTIIKQFIDTYFKLDKNFYIPANSFKDLSPDDKFSLGWIMHNVLHLTCNPIGYHLPLGLLASLIKREPHVVELEIYAKLMDENMYNMLNSMSVDDLKEEGYETRYDWLSMLCRYSSTDMDLYKPFADGFRAFSLKDPLEKCNIITADRFISGTREISVSELISKLMQNAEGTTYARLAEMLVDRLICASQEELKIFVFNLTGTFHLNGTERIEFDSMDKISYKFSVCFSKLYISKKCEAETFGLLIDELFEPQQARIVN
jgi:hypothetical protein